MKKNPIKISRICADYPILCSIIFSLCWFLFAAFEMYTGSKEFYFLDTDCYTRYLRITDWLNGDFSWFEKIFPFTNCPHGEILHFTRINDVLWLIFSLPFFAFMPVKEAIFAGGLIFSPILFIITMSLIMSGLKKYLGTRNFTKPSLFIFIISFMYLLKTMVFNFGRPDHHSLMLLFATYLSIALILPTNKKMFWAGIVAALGIWASSAFEGMLLAYIVLAILCIGIIFYKHSFSYAYYYTLGMFLGVLAAYILNPPFKGYLYFDNARLSLIHVAACGLTLAVFALCSRINLQKLWQKISFISVGAAVSFAILLMIFGINTVFTPIYDKKIIEYFVTYISEMKPILPPESWYLALGSLEILFLCRFFRRKKFADTALYTLFFLYLPIAAFIRRFLQYEILFFVFINAIMLTELFKNITKSETHKWATLLCIVVNLANALSFSYDVTPTRASYPKLDGCALTDIFFAPQMIYKTGITTLGSPYHNNVEGIVETIELFSLKDERQIRNSLLRYKIKYIVLPRYELSYLENLAENSLYKILKSGKTFSWLKLLNDKDEAFLFYEVIY